MTDKIHHMNRRSFLSQIGYGMGTLGFISAASPFGTLISSDNSDKITINRFGPHNGPVSFRKTIEWRFRFPKWRQCRIIYLEGLEIPKNYNNSLDQGVDGINPRVANHTRSPEYREYGFIEPVPEASNGKNDYPRISRIIGDAYTQFLREARELIKSRGKGITIHLHYAMLNDNGIIEVSSLMENLKKKTLFSEQFITISKLCFYGT